MLYSFLGISYGWPAAPGIMTACFVSDIRNGDFPFALLFEGLPLQLLYAIVPHYLRRCIVKGEDHKYRLDCVGRVLKYVLVCAVFSLLSALGAGTLLYVNYQTAPPLQPGLFVLIPVTMLISLACMVAFGKNKRNIPIGGAE